MYPLIPSGRLSLLLLEAAFSCTPPDRIIVSASIESILPQINSELPSRTNVLLTMKLVLIACEVKIYPELMLKFWAVKVKLKLLRLSFDEYGDFKTALLSIMRLPTIDYDMLVVIVLL